MKLARKNNDKAKYKKALELQLPSSSLYAFLEGRLPHPSLTYLRMIEIAESEEKEYINREIGERRTRLGATKENVTLEVKRDAFRQSKLEDLYRGLIDWTNDDVVRRQYEEKLLERACEELEFLSAGKKPAKRKEILRSAQDMVIIKHPFELAWNIVLEWKDIEEYSQWDVGVLREYIEFFPDTGLAKVLKGFLASELSPFPREEFESEGDAEQTIAGVTETAEADANEINDTGAADRLILMTEGLDMAPSSIIAHRIMGDLYLLLEEYESTVDVARKGLRNVAEFVRYTGWKSQNTTDALNIILANALIPYQSPRHHPEAKMIFENILQQKPTSTVCLLGVGLVLKVDQDYENAAEFLGRAIERDPTNIKIRGELFWCKALNGDLEAGLDGLQDALENLKAEQPQNKSFKSELLYRIGYCQWELDSSAAARKDRNGAYASFLASIKANMNYAPAYTSLGLYYADYKKDKTRARRCFHKAFELSSSETEAAERLARGFANQKEWDLVEAVAQRVVDSGYAKPAPGSKRKGHSWPYAALGTVQINKQQYSKSIVSFQAALRISPDDYHSWVGLAESYHHSGRYIAATKAFDHARELESNLSSEEKEHIWFARYMMANVKRELGVFDDAIACYEDVLATRPNDIGVTIALLQTLAESSWKSLDSGLFNDAAELACKVIQVAGSLVTVRRDIFNLWKSVGDACSNLTYIKKKIGKLAIANCKALLLSGVDPLALDLMTEVDGVGQAWLETSDGDEGASPDFCIFMSILAYKRAIHVSTQDTHAQAVAWYNLGWAEYRAYRSVQLGSGTKSKKPRKFLKASMRCFKRAIELEAGNSEFWNSLAVVTTSMSPKVAQHAFVRSLHLNDRSAQVWTNLGALYLLHNDVQLANEAFTRAQSTDPDYAQAWVGQGFLALLYGDSNEARGLFEHAFDISNSSAMLPKRQYSLTLFDHLLGDPSASNEVSQLIQPFFALHQLCAQDPSDLPFMHLSALLAERMGEVADAESSLEVVCSGMEAEFEETESPASLSRFAQANADMARVLLANHRYEEAAEKAETAITLSGEEDAENFDPEACSKLRLSAHLTAGLAYYFTKSMDQAIDMFRDALQEANNAPDVVCLLAQVLWAKGGEEERSVARQQLFDCVENHPDHVGAVTLLGAIALLDQDRDAIEAVESDLHNMVTRDDIDIHDRGKVLKLLAAISAMGFTEKADLPEDLRRIGEATAAVMLSPGQPQGWMELSAVSDSSYPAEMAIQRALRCVPPLSNLDASDLSQAYAQAGTATDAFRAIMVAPWRKEGWEELNDGITGLVA
jgi:superkiller protein 3